jgi:hypothetical protein
LQKKKREEGNKTVMHMLLLKSSLSQVLLALACNSRFLEAEMGKIEV